MVLSGLKANVSVLLRHGLLLPFTQMFQRNRYLFIDYLLLHELYSKLCSVRVR